MRDDCAVFRTKTRARVDPILNRRIAVSLTTPSMPSALRTIVATLMALVVLLVSTSLPGKAATPAGPIEIAVCTDESGRGDSQTFDAVVEPSWSPAVHATFATDRLSAPTLVPDIRRPTYGVLRL